MDYYFTMGYGVLWQYRRGRVGGANERQDLFDEADERKGSGRGHQDGACAHHPAHRPERASGYGAALFAGRHAGGVRHEGPVHR